MSRAIHGAAFAVSLVLGLASAGPDARAGIRLWPTEQCDTPRVLRHVVKGFNWAQRTTFGHDVRIAALVEPHQYAARRTEPFFHDRRYCRATAVMDDGFRNAVYYLISDDGYPPLQNGVVFCVVGHDYFRAYAPGCSQLQPR